MSCVYETGATPLWVGSIQCRSSDGVELGDSRELQRPVLGRFEAADRKALHKSSAIESSEPPMREQWPTWQSDSMNAAARAIASLDPAPAIWTPRSRPFPGLTTTLAKRRELPSHLGFAAVAATVSRSSTLQDSWVMPHIATSTAERRIQGTMDGGLTKLFAVTEANAICA